MLWWQLSTIVIGVLALLTLWSISSDIQDVRYKLGNVVASDKKLEELRAQLWQIGERLESLDRAVHGIEIAATPVTSFEDCLSNEEPDDREL